MKKDWFEHLDAAVTVCDKEGVIVYMNKRSEETFANDGGKALIGSSLLDCHPPKAAEQIRKMLTEQKENIYTIEKKGIKKIIIQKPVFAEGKFDGLVEMSIVLPANMPHFKRG